MSNTKYNSKSIPTQAYKKNQTDIIQGKMKYDNKVFYFIWIIMIHISNFQSHAFSSSLILEKNMNPMFNHLITRSNLKRKDGSIRQMNENNEYDLIVIGGGPVGVRAAIVAASSPYKKKVCLIDSPTCSGVLMNQDTKEDLSIGSPTGLFSKALRDTSKRISVTTLRGMGLREESVWNEITSACIDLATTNAYDVSRQLSFADVTYVTGLVSFTGNYRYLNDEMTKKKRLVELLVKENDDLHEECLYAKNVLIATGSKPFRPNNIPFDGKRIFDSDSINGLTYLPRSIAITGSGIIAIEYAKIFRNLGAEVTLIIRDKFPRRALSKIGLDIDIAGCLVADLVRSGIKFERNAQVQKFETPKSGQKQNLRAPIKLYLEGKDGEQRQMGRDEISCDAYLAAVGRTPNTKELNTDAIGIQTDEYGGILVNGCMQTNVPNVYAAGDVVGRPFLASTGVAQGAAAVEAMFHETSMLGEVKIVQKDPNCDPNKEECEMIYVDEDNKEIDGSSLIDNELLKSSGANFDPKSLSSNPFAFPVGIWSSPEAAYFGLTKEQAIDLGIDAAEGMSLYAECLRGQVFSPNGMLKIVFEKPKGRILGVHICGDDACELIHYGMELVRGKRTVEDVVNNLYSAVTFHEMYRIAAMAGLDEDSARKRRAAAGIALARRNRSIFSSTDNK